MIEAEFGLISAGNTFKCFLGTPFQKIWERFI